MRNWWIRFGCFLTGYNYGILQGCSEVSYRTVKRYTAALVIIGILWSFIGYSFVNKYLHGSWYVSAFGALLFLLIIIQVERQIILSEGSSSSKYWLRGFIAFIMAIIGSVIIDQIIFKDDIAHRQLFELNAQVDSLMPSKEAELKRQAAAIDSSLNRKEAERKALMDDINKNPFVQTVNKETKPVSVQKTTVDSNKTAVTDTKVINKTSYVVTSVPNPKSFMVSGLDQQIKDLRNIKMEHDDRIVKLRKEVEQQASANNGFLYELQLMYKILRDSGPALGVWLLWFFLLLGIEIFIMVNKMTHIVTDYDVCVTHHMHLQKRKLQLLAMQVADRQHQN